jgi:hypothetical protein
MGRLSKAKTDEIAKMRKEGYTQKEIAEKLHVHPRTVRNYDPLRQGRPEVYIVKDRLSALEEAVKTSWDYIDLLYNVIRRYPALNYSLENDTFYCPRCPGKLTFDKEKVTYICIKCGYGFPPPEMWCYQCLSQTEMNYIEETGKWVCRKCGASR